MPAMTIVGPVEAAGAIDTALEGWPLSNDREWETYDNRAVEGVPVTIRFAPFVHLIKTGKIRAAVTEIDGVTTYLGNARPDGLTKVEAPDAPADDDDEVG